MGSDVLTYEALMEFKKAMEKSYNNPPRPIGLIPAEYDFMVKAGLNMDGYKRLELLAK